MLTITDGSATHLSPHPTGRPSARKNISS